MFPKKKREKNKELLASYHGKKCVICGSSEGVGAHHLKTRGAGGGDSPDNLIPLCGFHHREVHQLGALTFKDKYGLE